VRRATGLNQIELSRRSGVAQSALSLIEGGSREPTWETVDRILRSTGTGIIAVPTRRPDACASAALIAAAESRGDKPGAAREFIQLSDNLAQVHAGVRVALTICEPASTGVKHWDAAIAGLVAYRLEEESLPVPPWAREPARRLKKAWTFGDGEYTTPVPREHVPKAFLDVNVIIDSATLMSV
jgi:transcriptional regulator with XRE-family HTH domain